MYLLCISAMHPVVKESSWTLPGVRCGGILMYNACIIGRYARRKGRYASVTLPLRFCHTQLRVASPRLGGNPARGGDGRRAPAREAGFLASHPGWATPLAQARLDVTNCRGRCTPLFCLQRPFSPWWSRWCRGPFATLPRCPDSLRFVSFR